MKKAACFLLILVAGCSNMNAVISSWEGSHINEVIAQWGYPDSQQEIAGRTIYRWVDRDFRYMPQYSTISGRDSSYGNFYGSTYSNDSYDKELSCTRILEVNDAGYVIAGRWEGGNCDNMYWMNKNKVKTKDNRTTYAYPLPDPNESVEKPDTSLARTQLSREQDENNVEQSEPNAPIRKIKGYRSERDLKTGEMKIYPVYEQEQLPDSGKSSEKLDTALNRAQLASKQDANDVEQSEPNAPIRKIKGYRAERDLKTGEIKIYPVYEDEQKK